MLSIATDEGLVTKDTAFDLDVGFVLSNVYGGDRGVLLRVHFDVENTDQNKFEAAFFCHIYYPV